VFVYSYIPSEKGSLVEYNDDLAVKNLKSFCQEHLPRFSKRVNLNHFEFPSSTTEKLPRVMLLSTKKDTPIIWRVLSGLYHKRFIFYDAEVCYGCLLARLFISSFFVCLCIGLSLYPLMNLIGV
jgi:hypothetical protein